MQDMNFASLISSGQPAIKLAWASAQASSTKCYQLVGFSGGSSAHSATVEVIFGITPVDGTVKYSGLAKASGASISEYYGIDGPLTSQGQGIFVRTRCAVAGEPVYANLLYRIVL